MKNHRHTTQATALWACVLYFSGTAYAQEMSLGANTTSVTPALECLGERRPVRPLPRLAVGRIGDLTGKVDWETGAKVTQGASLFAITALNYAHIPTVERLDSSVSDIELNYARQQLLSDTPERAGTAKDNFRPVLAGQIAGSSYYIIGGITELNYNIKSSGYDASLGSIDLPGVRGQLTGQTYVLNIAVDLRLVDTRSQQVINTTTFQKQVIGVTHERNLGGGTDDLGLLLKGGDSQQEPIQMAVRELIERATYELVSPLWPDSDGAACLETIHTTTTKKARP